MTNKITEVNDVFYLGTIKANVFQLQGLIFIRAFLVVKEKLNSCLFIPILPL